jgi:crystallin alpha B
LDVEEFTPDELLVHFTSRELIIEGKHQEKTDEHGFVSRHFKRRYAVPTDIIEDDMVCSISSDGVLTVHIPRVQPKVSNKKIAIVQTGQPAAK